MSFNVLIIPEDSTNDQFILKPLIQKMIRQFNRNAIVDVCLDPVLGGLGEALKWERLDEIIERYPMVKLFLLIVDRDCEQNRKQKLNNLEAKAIEKFAAERPATKSRYFFAEHAWQEVEVWTLAGQADLPKNWSMKEIRADCDPKEAYYEPYKRAHNKTRKTLGKEAAKNYRRIRQLCPEDIGGLEYRVNDLFNKERGFYNT
ncbi:hypothetical protein [Candidatus Venteria ishoeyi]|uniref:DUF4276 domain-containing protein n=1 Tax=Candidatus Venteria ishoeyi TaxID=1899563 RepID=A0A1H6FFX0_9GAMM|nr:hypothetical protein [Candidatus Venteria ishoeyi]MDM8545841.1 hypothetical protein [Candidatus Venteria ishoeyi]SEH08301.1 Uncharacterised protein [Candidatus Venteria ishoeyi]